MIKATSKNFHDCENEVIKTLFKDITVNRTSASNTIDSIKYLYFRKNYEIKSTNKK